MIRVLSIIEPWASLIAHKIKYIETRSFKTNYRGELYIHASLKKLSAKDNHVVSLLELLPDVNLMYGHVIAKCKLVDCVYMDEKFLKEIKNNKTEHLCGDYKLGRYGWILEDIELLDTPFKVKGNLGIWKYNEGELK